MTIIKVLHSYGLDQEVELCSDPYSVSGQFHEYLTHAATGTDPTWPQIPSHINFTSKG